jgi:hypothetical protein
MAYARVKENQAVLTIFNNDTNAANVQFDVSMIKQFSGNVTLNDRLEKVKDVKIENGKIKFSMPARTAGIFTIK